MAKSKKGTKNLVLAIICFLFGALLFSSMFMPMIKVDYTLDEETFSAVDVITAMGFADVTEDPIQHGKDILNASDGEILADDMLFSDNAASTKAAGILNMIASIFGGLLMVMAILSLFCKSKLLKKLMLVFGVLGTLCAVGSIISAFILLGELSEIYSIHAACFIAVISGLISTVGAVLNK